MPVPEEGEIAINDMGLKTLEASDSLFLTTSLGMSGRARVGDLLNFLIAQSFTFTSGLPESQVMIPGVTVGDMIGRTYRDLIEELYIYVGTLSSAPPTNNSFPYTLPFTLS